MPGLRTSLLLSVLCLFGACKSTATGASAAGDGVAAVQFPDARVPDGLNLRDRFHESYSSETGGWRYGHFVYAGQTSVDDACAHLLAHMPDHKWTLAADERTEESTRKLKFTRGRYVADYTLRRQDGITEMVIDYRTEISPR